MGDHPIQLPADSYVYMSAACRHSLRVIDWGSAILKAPGEKLHQVIGTPYYVAPEVLHRDYDEKAGQ